MPSVPSVRKYLTLCLRLGQPRASLLCQPVAGATILPFGVSPFRQQNYRVTSQGCVAKLYQQRILQGYLRILMRLPPARLWLTRTRSPVAPRPDLPLQVGGQAAPRRLRIV